MSLLLLLLLLVTAHFRVYLADLHIKMEADGVGDVALSEYQKRLRDRFLAAPVVPAPPPWQPVLDRRTPIGGLHATTPDGWCLDVVAPEWPHDRVILSSDGGLWKGQQGESWWHVFHSDYSTLHAAGFSPSGRILAVATSSDLTLWAREGNWDEYR